MPSRVLTEDKISDALILLLGRLWTGLKEVPDNIPTRMMVAEHLASR
jgi:hypothetical protein